MVRDDPARTPIKSKGQIKPSLSGLDLSDIALPNPARPIGGRHFGQPVFRDLIGVTTLGRARPKSPLLPGTQTFLTHESSNAILPAAFAPLAQIPTNAQAAIGGAAL